MTASWTHTVTVTTGEAVIVVWSAHGPYYGQHMFWTGDYYIQRNFLTYDEGYKMTAWKHYTGWDQNGR